MKNSNLKYYTITAQLKGMMLLVRLDACCCGRYSGTLFNYPEYASYFNFKASIYPYAILKKSIPFATTEEE
jgi:hypothetical protein